MASKLYSKLAASIALAALCGAALQAQPKEKKVKDQAEYDLTQAINKEADPNKKMQLLQQWKDKYAESDFKGERAQMICVGYQQLGQAAKMWDACSDLVTLDPKSFLGLYFLTSLTTSMNDTSATRLDAGEKFARSFLANIDELKKPANVPEDKFKEEVKNYRTLGMRTLAWIDFARNKWEKAEESLTNFLNFNPNSGNASYWLSTSMLRQQKKEKQIPALFHLARAAHYKGADELAPAAKQQLQSFLEKTYVSYHGNKEGLQEVIDLALKNPFPAADFKIKSAGEILQEQDDLLRTSDPQKYLWVGLKKGLMDPANGQKYWEESLKDSGMPKLKGKVVEVKPANRPKEITVSILVDGTAEIRLRMDSAFANKAEPGTEIEFEGGTAKEFSADPFLLTIEQEKEKLTGWPAAPKPAPKAGAPKKAAPKKK